jgi:hypothetical protein
MTASLTGAFMTTKPFSRSVGSLTLSAVVAASALCATQAFAGDTFKGVLGVTLTGGGDKLATVTYTNGNSQNIKSGGLLHIFGGVEYVPTNAFALQATVGYHVDDSNAKNGSVKFSRVPVEVLGFWKAADTWRFGLGLRKTSGAKLTSSGEASNIGNFKLDSKLGAVLQGEYLFNPSGSVFVRYVGEKYTVNKVGVSGNHVGLGTSFRF